MIHHTRGTYTNGSFKDNGVSSENLAEHIKYNLLMRPGRAFFLDGICLNEAYLTKEEVTDMEKKFKETPVKMPRDTQPYV